jgi:hypothetical protein
MMRYSTILPEVIDGSLPHCGAHGRTNVTGDMEPKVSAIHKRQEKKCSRIARDPQGYGKVEI